MFTKSLWHTFSNPHPFPSLTNNIKVDVAIIGAGITGLTAAKELSDKGMNVAVLEKSGVGSGTTGYSTGNLYSTVDKQLSSVLSKYSTSDVAKIVEARSTTIDKIEQYIMSYNIDCDFKRVPWYLYSSNEKKDGIIKDEFRHSDEVMIPISMAGSEDIPFSVSSAIKSLNQAQFNPFLYVQGLAKAINNDRCRIYENSEIHEIKEHGSYIELKTEVARVEADYVIHATHTPKGVKLVHTLLGPYREYGIACKIDEAAHPEGIFWGYFEDQDKYSTRIYSRNNDTYLIVVGKPHKTGQASSNVKHIQELENFARKYFKIKEVTHRWGGQHYRPADSLPYIGRDREGSNIFIATGYSTDGLVYGTLAGNIISDTITGTVNEWENLFRSTRSQPLKAANKFIKENLDVAKQFLKYIPGTFKDEDFAAIAPGEGKILERDEGKVAVYKDEKGNITACSAICPHLGCIVNWNNAEQTWDCPCHASRFSTDGKLLEGPSLHHLNPIDVKNSES